MGVELTSVDRWLETRCHCYSPGERRSCSSGCCWARCRTVVAVMMEDPSLAAAAEGAGDVDLGEEEGDDEGGTSVEDAAAAASVQVAVVGEWLARLCGGEGCCCLDDEKEVPEEEDCCPKPRCWRSSDTRP